MTSDRPYIALTHEKSVVEYNPGETFVFLSVAVDAYPDSWTVQWFKDGDLIAGDHPRLRATYVLMLFVSCNDDQIVVVVVVKSEVLA